MSYYTKEQIDELLLKTKQEAVEEALRALPAIIQNLVVSASRLQKVSTEFYKDNKDLVEHKDLVGKIIQEVEADNPGISFEKITEEAAVETRKRLSFGDTLSSMPTPKPTEEKLRKGMESIMEAFDA